MPPSHKESRHVNHLLHTLRGEQFRHSQNLLRSRAHITSTRVTRLPTLPANLFESDYNVASDDASTTTPLTLRSPSYSGPEPPRSWITRKDHPLETPHWRKQALSLIFDCCGTPRENLFAQIPALSLLCLQKLLSVCSASEFKENVVPFIPSHLRRDIIRYAAVESPLPNSKLFALFEPDGHADGEIIVVGPKASLQDGYSFRGYIDTNTVGNISEIWDWDEETAAPKALDSLILMSTGITQTTLLTFPPTLTHLALINLSVPVPLHRLPNVCPLLEILDISYNEWLSNCSKDVLNILNRIDWVRWFHMRILGARNCDIPEEVLQRVNRNRWDDVLIVQ